MVYVNENILKTKRVFPRQNRYHCHRYDMNENPEGLPKEFVDEVLKEVTPQFLSIYPEQDRFLKKYSDFIGVGFENVIATNGLDMAIRYLLEIFGEKNKNVVTVSPSFEMYWVNCNILGLKHVPVPYNDDLTLDINKILDAINEDTRVVVLVNPNNPVGNVYSNSEIEAIVTKAAKYNALVIVDEAYHYFYDKTFLNHVFKYDNVLVMRTFSKLFSMAACRLGVVIGNKKLIEYVKTARLTFDVNSFALLFGEKILDHPDLIDRLIESERKGKEYTLNLLKENNYKCMESKGNFIFIETKTDAHVVSDKLEKEYNVLVHAYGNEMLRKYIRVSTGSIEAMKFFMDCLLKCDK
ncbi:MAG: histidinol-phosphate aminotransferase family protein [Anaeroplasmataceae bacterium]|nr:histidinol-phosphate aminotransferase family protein [Anaeroplasmataceae bacterium]